jgi:hypothetical protein
MLHKNDKLSKSWGFNFSALFISINVRFISFMQPRMQGISNLNSTHWKNTTLSTFWIFDTFETQELSRAIVAAT